MSTDILTTPRLLVAGTGSGVGKSLFVMALAQELRRRGVAVAACVTAPALAQATILRRITGRYVHTLDQQLLSGPQLLRTLQRAATGAELVLIDGNAGLFDGMNPGTQRGSDAQLAALTQTPVLLVADVHGMKGSAAALVKGFYTLADELQMVGSVLNRCGRLGEPIDGSARREFSEVFQRHQLPAPLAVMPTLDLSLRLPEQANPQARNFTSLSRQDLMALGEVAGRAVDVDALLTFAGQAAAVPLAGGAEPTLTRRTRIAVADDLCFHLGFQDNFDLLRRYGAELVPFSPLADRELPSRIGAVYLGGAALPEYARELEENSAMRDSIVDFVQDGGVLFAEASGAAWMCREVALTGSVAGKLRGLGLLPGTASYEAAAAPEILEGVTVEESVVGRPGLIAKMYGTGEWRMRLSSDLLHVFRVAHPGQRMGLDGYSPGAQVVACNSFVHFGSNTELARALVDNAEVVYQLTSG